MGKRDSWLERTGSSHTEGEGGGGEPARGPAPGKITSSSLIGNPDPPQWYRPGPGKRPLTSRLQAKRQGPPRPPVEAAASRPGENGAGSAFAAEAPARQAAWVEARAADGVAGSGGVLPHRDAIQAAFGRHDIGDIQAHGGGAAAEAAADIGARAYATGDHVAFAAGAPDLHTAAHEAAHVIQQRAGVAPKGIDGGAGDVFERHADQVADAVVRGESAEPLLDRMAGAGRTASAPVSGGSVQRDADDKSAGVDADVLPPPQSVTWHGDPFQIRFQRTGKGTGNGALVIEAQYTGSSPTVGGPFVKGAVVHIELSAAQVFYMTDPPLKGSIKSQGAGQLVLDLYGDERQLVKIADELEVRLKPEAEKGRRHTFRAFLNGRDITSLWIIVRDDKVSEADAPAKPEHQEDVPGEAPKAFLKDGGTEIRIDGDGDQHKELLLFFKPGGEEHAPGVPKSVVASVTQLASGKKQTAVLALPRKDIGGALWVTVKQPTDGYTPTEITLQLPDTLLKIAPPVRSGNHVVYTLQGPSDAKQVSFPPEPEGQGPHRIASAGAAETIGGIHSVDLKLGAYGDSFRVTVEPNQKILSFSAKERGRSGPVGGFGAKIALADVKPMRVLDTDGLRVALDLNEDGKPDVEIFDLLTAMHENVSPESDRKHTVRLVGSALAGEQKLYFRIESNVFHGPFASDTDLDKAASSNAQAVTGLKEQAALGSFQQNMDAFEGAMFAARKQAFDDGIIDAAIYQNWEKLNGDLLVLRAQIAGKTVSPALQGQAAGHADGFYQGLAAATKGREKVTSATAGFGYSRATTENPYTGEEKTESWTLFLGSETSVKLFATVGAKLRLGQFDEAFKAYNALVGGLDRWIATKLKEKGTKAGKEAAERLEYLGAMRTKLGELADKNVTRLQAVFHPDAGYKEALRVKEVPLAIYYWRTATEWKVKDLTNPNNTFEDEVDAKEGETEPPASLWKELDYKSHFPKGIIHYQVPGGTGGQLATTERKTLSDWLTYIGLGVAAIGLGLATFGTGTVAVIGAYTLAASSLIGAGAALAHSLEESDHGNLSDGELALDIAQIAAGLLGAAQLAAGRLVMSAGAASRVGAPWAGNAARIAQWAQAGYVPLTVGRIGADVVTVALASKELAKQLDEIEKSGATADERSRLKALLLSQFAVTAGLVGLSIKGDLPSIAKGKSLYFYTPKDGGPLVAAHMEKPADVKFSQATVSPATSDDIPIEDLVKSMKTDGWKGDPIDVVQLNGELISIDNRRLYAARTAGIEAPVKMHQAGDKLPPEQSGRFKLNTDIYELPDGTLTTAKPEGNPAPKYRKGSVAETWGEAVTFRTANQEKLTGVRIPLDGSADLPAIARSVKALAPHEVEAVRRAGNAAVSGGNPEPTDLTHLRRLIASGRLAEDGLPRELRQHLALTQSAGLDVHNHLLGVQDSDYFIKSVGNGSAAATLNKTYDHISSQKNILAAVKDEAPSAWKALEDGKARVDDLIKRGAKPEEVEAAARKALDDSLAAGDTPFDETYTIRDEMIKKFIGYDKFTRDSMEALAAEGVGYSEQSVSVKKLQDPLSQAKMAEAANATGNKTDMRFLAMVHTDNFAERGVGKLSEPDFDKDILGPLKNALKRGDVMGVDIAGPEMSKFTDLGIERFKKLYTVLSEAAKQRKRPLVLRPHVGEGFSGRGTTGGHETGGDNLEKLIAALEGIGYSKAKGEADMVIVRFGHGTHASPEQIKRMAKLGVITEANIGSNLATGSIGNESEHPLLIYLYHDAKVVLSTDAQGVMSTTLIKEYQRAADIINEFRAGKFPINIDGKSIHFQDLPPNKKANFSIEKLQKTAAEYHDRIRAGDADDASR